MMPSAKDPNEHTPPTEAELDEREEYMRGVAENLPLVDWPQHALNAYAEVRRLRAERSVDSVDAARWRTIRPALGVDGDNATGEAYPLPDTVQWITFDDESLPSLHGCDNTVETIIDAARRSPRHERHRRAVAGGDQDLRRCEGLGR